MCVRVYARACTCEKAWVFVRACVFVCKRETERQRERERERAFVCYACVKIEGKMGREWLRFLCACQVRELHNTLLHAQYKVWKVTRGPWVNRDTFQPIGKVGEVDLLSGPSELWISKKRFDQTGPRWCAQNQAQPNQSYVHGIFCIMHSTNTQLSILHTTNCS